MSSRVGHLFQFKLKPDDTTLILIVLHSGSNHAVSMPWNMANPMKISVKNYNTKFQLKNYTKLNYDECPCKESIRNIIVR